MCEGPNCSRELPPGSRVDQQFCSQGCRLRAFRQRRRLDKLRSNSPETAKALADEMSLTELAARRRGHRPDHWADIEAGRVDPGLIEHTDHHDLVALADDDPGDLAWSDTYRVQQAVEKIENHYRKLARPLLAQQARNGGVRLPGLVKLEQECADKIDAIVKAHERAQALDRAARRQPATVATAHERQLEQAALRSLAADLPGRRHRHAEPEPAGRDVRSTWSW